MYCSSSWSNLEVRFSQQYDVKRNCQLSNFEFRARTIEILELTQLITNAEVIVEVIAELITIADCNRRFIQNVRHLLKDM